MASENKETKKSNDNTTIVPPPKIEKFELKKWLKIGNFIDAVDTVRDWKVGEIVEANFYTNQIKIHFDGWRGKWDEVRFDCFIFIYYQWYRVNSYRIAPFSKCTKGYSGQKS